MSRHEFIEILQAYLNRSLAPSLVADHINYYEEYIRSRVALGENEQEVLLQLGDPRLIARTILQTHGGAENGTFGQSVYEETYGSAGAYGNRQDDYRDVTVKSGSDRESGSVFRQIPGWLFWLLIIGGICLVLGLVMSIVWFMIPLLIPAAVIFLLIKLFRDWLN